MNNKFWIIILIMLSCLIRCDNNDEGISCDGIPENFEGAYLVISETDTASNNLQITLDNETFESNGISGYGFWFPTAPFSGTIKDCQVTIDSYHDVERQGLSSPGGTPRFYSESMNGSGDYFPDQDSIKLRLTYERTGDFPLYFNEEIYLKKTE